MWAAVSSDVMSSEQIYENQLMNIKLISQY